MLSKNYAILKAGNMGGDLVSEPIKAGAYPHASIQATWTGTPTGELVVQTSDDEGANGVITNWSTLTSTSVSLVGVAGNFSWNLDVIAANFIRLIYNRSSSTGVLGARTTVKGNAK